MSPEEVSQGSPRRPEDGPILVAPPDYKLPPPPSANRGRPPTPVVKMGPPPYTPVPPQTESRVLIPEETPAELSEEIADLPEPTLAEEHEVPERDWSWRDVAVLYLSKYYPELMLGTFLVLASGEVTPDNVGKLTLGTLLGSMAVRTGMVKRFFQGLREDQPPTSTVPETDQSTTELAKAMKPTKEERQAQRQEMEATRREAELAQAKIDAAIRLRYDVFKLAYEKVGNQSGTEFWHAVLGTPEQQQSGKKVGLKNVPVAQLEEMFNRLQRFTEPKIDQKNPQRELKSSLELIVDSLRNVQSQVDKRRETLLGARLRRRINSGDSLTADEMDQIRRSFIYPLNRKIEDFVVAAVGPEVPKDHPELVSVLKNFRVSLEKRSGRLEVVQPNVAIFESLNIVLKERQQARTMVTSIWSWFSQYDKLHDNAHMQERKNGIGIAGAFRFFGVNDEQIKIWAKDNSISTRQKFEQVQLWLLQKGWDSRDYAVFQEIRGQIEFVKQANNTEAEDLRKNDRVTRMVAARALWQEYLQLYDWRMRKIDHSNYERRIEDQDEAQNFLDALFPVMGRSNLQSLGLSREAVRELELNFASQYGTRNNASANRNRGRSNVAGRAEAILKKIPAERQEQLAKEAQKLPPNLNQAVVRSGLLGRQNQPAEIFRKLQEIAKMTPLSFVSPVGQAPLVNSLRGLSGETYSLLVDLHENIRLSDPRMRLPTRSRFEWNKTIVPEPAPYHDTLLNIDPERWLLIFAKLTLPEDLLAEARRLPQSTWNQQTLNRPNQSTSNQPWNSPPPPPQPRPVTQVQPWNAAPRPVEKRPAAPPAAPVQPTRRSPEPISITDLNHLLASLSGDDSPTDEIEIDDEELSFTEMSADELEEVDEVIVERLADLIDSGVYEFDKAIESLPPTTLHYTLQSLVSEWIDLKRESERTGKSLAKNKFAMAIYDFLDTDFEDYLDERQEEVDRNGTMNFKDGDVEVQLNRKLKDILANPRL